MYSPMWLVQPAACCMLLHLPPGRFFGSCSMVTQLPSRELEELTCRDPHLVYHWGAWQPSVSATSSCEVLFSTHQQAPEPAAEAPADCTPPNTTTMTPLNSSSAASIAVDACNGLAAWQASGSCAPRSGPAKVGIDHSSIVINLYNISKKIKHFKTWYLDDIYVEKTQWSPSHG